MARQQPQGRPRNEIGFREIELLKEETLGVGSYGSVCKARCDHLLCAAKIIHPTLVPPNALQQISPQREHRLPIRRFEMECDFLKEIRHPNIIQYLGMYRDPETGLPVLLMELMDESLTHFLEASTEPIPYHIQLTICLDIVQALSFLHLNGIIHRDLSSNNILLIGKGRAKLTDFGMAKLVDVRMSRVSNTMCPGTDAYMPPEAIDNQAVYTEKGDVFSFGVNIIQILTRKFPKPGDRFKMLQIDHPQVPSGRVEVRVPEIERRNNHISEINTAHPLLPIALDCLKNQEGERPSTGELCQRLAALKDIPEYTESERAVEDRRTTQQTTLAEKDRQITELCQQLLSQQREHDQQIQQSQGALTARQQEIQDLREELREKDQLIATRDQHLGNKEREKDCLREELREKDQLIATRDQHLGNKEREKDRLREELREKDQLIATRDQHLGNKEREKDCLREELREKDQLIATRDQHLGNKEREKDRLREELREKEQIITTRDRQQRDHEEMIAQFQRRIEGLELNSRPQPRAQSLSPSDIARATPPTQPSRGHQPAQRPPSTSSGEGVIRLNWTQGRWAPCEMYRSADAGVDGSVAYIRPNGTEQVHAYNSTTDTWSRLPDCRTKRTTLAIVNGLLTTVGGEVGGNYSNKLISLTGEGRDRKWTEVFPPMTTKRESVIAVTAGRALIVAGGYGDRGGLATVEIMNTDTRQWSRAADLPQTMYLASATVCGDCIYMCDRESVISCSLPALLQSCSPKIFEAQPSTPSPQGPVWSTVTDLPVRLSTLVSINNRLLAIGGLDSEYKPTTAVHLYCPVNNSWQTISYLSTARWECFAVVLPNNRIMVVGGCTTESIISATNTVEFASVVNV